LAITPRYIVHFHRTRLEYSEPVCALRKTTEDNGIFLRIEFSNEMVAGLGWSEGCRHRQTSLCI